MEVTDSVTENAYAAVRDALIQVVREIHPRPSDVSNNIESMAAFMKGFSTVISLNYDILVYWAMQKGNDSLGTWFKDCFLDGSFDFDWERLRVPWKATGSTLVFYPHGSLALGYDYMGRVRKLTRNNDTRPLLDAITSAWRTGDASPLFVSEGSSSQKVQAIGLWPYLETVRTKVIPSLVGTVVTFGWNVSESDAHIVAALGASSVTQMAIGVYVGSKTGDEVELECDRVRLVARQYAPSIDVRFFDASTCPIAVSD